MGTERPFTALFFWQNAKRFVLFYSLWLILSEARNDFLALGLFAALVTTWLSHLIWRDTGKQFRLVQIFAFLPGFLWRAFLGGLDVARRVFHPDLPVHPAFVTHQCREEDETGRVLLCDVLSLIPGTLGAGLEGRQAVVHLLSDEAATRRIIVDEETRVLALLEQQGQGPVR